jgi:hypothetical protein
VALLKMETENLCAVYSLVPFIAWYVAIAIENCDRWARLDVSSVSLDMLRDWTEITLPKHNHKFCNSEFSYSQLFADALDLVRSLNSVISGSHVILT